MSIPLREYKDGLESGDAKILATLETKPYQAYTLSDMSGAVSDNLLLSTLQFLALNYQLERLIKKNLVKSKNIGGTIYYISAKAI